MVEQNGESVTTTGDAEAESRSVLDALKDLHTHFTTEASAGAAAVISAEEQADEPSPRLGKASCCCFATFLWV